MNKALDPESEFLLLYELIENLAAGVMILSPDMEITLSNPVADQTLSLPETKPCNLVAIRQSWQLYGSNGSPLSQSECPLQEIIQSGRGCDGMQLGVRVSPKDSIRWLLLHANVVQTETGETKQIVVSFAHISHLRAAQERLRESAAVFSCTLEGVIITDSENRIRDVNQAFTNITGYSRAEVLGRNPSMLQSGKQSGAFYAAMWKSIQETGHWRGELWNRRKNGDIYPQLLTISTVSDGGDASGFVAVFSDISAVKQTQDELEHLAHHDPLTGLPNRLLLLSRLEQSIKRAKRNQSILAVVFIDLDNFKHINDSLGHPVGDELLIAFSSRLSERIREVDSLARISGDEFVMLLEDLDHPEHLEGLIKKITAVLKHPFHLVGHDLSASASFGISTFPKDGTDSDTLMRNADAAMYHAKQEGKNTYAFYHSKLTSQAFEHLFIENALHSALSKQQMYLVYQPQFYSINHEIVGVEALLRWEHPVQGPISPDRFIPIAEQNGFIQELGNWVLRKACEQARFWLDAGLFFGRVAVNISGPQIIQESFPSTVQKILEDNGLDASYLGLEVTESFVMVKTKSGVRQLEALRDMGVEIAIDDFGTGYSSLSYLTKLPIDKLKIDQSFVQKIPSSPDDMAIANAIVSMGRALKKSVIAEGVETAEQAEFMLTHGCTEIQGFLHGKPASAHEVIKHFPRRIQ